MLQFDWLREYTSIPTPSGGEKDGQKFWLEQIMSHCDDYVVDAYGNATGIINPGRDFSVMITAHGDEIGWYVKKIDDEGFVHVELGPGSDEVVVLSHEAMIHTQSGPVPMCVRVACSSPTTGTTQEFYYTQEQ